VNTNWPRNLRVNPAATLKIGSQTFRGTAALEITDSAERVRSAGIVPNQESLKLTTEKC
jgi:hypothetical protein